MVRSKQRAIVTVAALIFGPVFMLGPAALGVLMLIYLWPDYMSVLGLLLMVGGSAFIAYHMLQNYHWVEFDGTCIRGRRFWTRRLVEQTVDDIVAIKPMGAVARSLETIITDKLLGSVRGFEIQFRHGPTIGLLRGDMAHVEELIEAVQARSGVPLG